MPVPEDADRRFTRWQGELERTQPQQSSKWESFMESRTAKALSHFGDGVSESLIGMGHALSHPIDNIIMPAAELIGDVSALAFNADYGNQSAQRMDRRWEQLKNTAIAEYDIFTGGNLNDIAHELGGAATFFGGVAMFKGARAFGGAYQAGRFLNEANIVSESATKARISDNVTAARLGNDAVGDKFNRFSRRATAIKFYSQNEFKIEQTLAHMRGIDFTKPVQVSILEKGTEVVQYMLPNKSVGSYFSQLGTPGSQLGIYTSGRSPTTFFPIQNVSVLKSTAAAMIDDYSMVRYGWKIETKGGGIQYFSPLKSAWEKK